MRVRCPTHGMCGGSIGGLRRQLVHNVKERGPPRGGPESIMTQLQEAGISPIGVNARPPRASLRGCVAIEEFDKGAGKV